MESRDFGFQIADLGLEKLQSDQIQNMLDSFDIYEKFYPELENNKNKIEIRLF